MAHDTPRKDADDIFSPVEPGGRTVGGNVRKYKKKRLTTKQRKTLQALVKNPELTLEQAGKKGGYHGDTKEMARKAILSAREQFVEAMNRNAAMQDDNLIKKIAEGFDATETKFFAHEGSVVDEREVVNYAARYSYLSLATKLKGTHPDNRMELTGAGGKDLIPAASGPDFSFLSKDQLLALAERPDYFVAVDAAVETTASAPDPAGAIMEAQIIPADNNVMGKAEIEKIGPENGILGE